MRWNCPHCSVVLAISDEKLNSGWSFSRCYKCGGFALVRKSDVNLIKVDRAPQDENVLLPESSEEPLLSQTATQNLIKHTEKTTLPQSPFKPIVKPGTRGSKTTPENNSSNFLDFPEPLPEKPQRELSRRLLKLGIGMALVASISSGTYLYIQSNELWNKARAVAVSESKEPQTSSEIIAAPTLVAPNVPTPIQAKTEIVDRIQNNAMAPVQLEKPLVKSFEKPTLVLEVKAKHSPLRSGPGLAYPIVGIANAQFKFIVQDWKNQWFKVSVFPENESKQTAKATPKNMWIRNDLVKVVSR